MRHARNNKPLARLAALSALLLVAAAGCSDSDDTGGSGGGGGGGAGFDGASGVDVGAGGEDGAAGGDSAGTEDSAGGGAAKPDKVCVNVGECEAAVECGSGFYCDPCTKTCEEERVLCEPCDSNAQCEKADLGSVCIPYANGVSACGLACLGDAGCPKDHSCVEVAGANEKQCVPNTNSCQPNAGDCANDADCPFGSICNASFGTCLKGCTEDTACPGGQVCSLFRCVAPCTTDESCKEQNPAAICEDERCKIPGGCLSSAECLEPETYCDLNTNKCVPGCKVDSDCKDFAKACENDACVTKGCEANWSCAWGEVCDVGSGVCEKAEGPYCGECDASDETAAACGGEPNRCLTFTDPETEEEKGDFCLVLCSTDPGGPCPQGYSAQELQDQDGNSEGCFCVRQCWITPPGLEEGDGA